MKVLVFFPPAGLWDYTFSMGSFMEKMISKGNEVLLVGCDGIYNQYCDVMRSSGIPIGINDSSRICARCQKIKHFIRDELRVKQINLDDHVTVEDRSRSDEWLSSLTPKTAMDFVLGGLPLGRIAFYLIVTTYKKSSTELNEKEWIDLKISLRHVIYTWLGLKKVIDSFNPDLGFVYNSLYPNHNVLRYLLDQRGVTTQVIHGSMNLDHMESDIFISPKDPFYYALLTKEVWGEYQSVPCEPKQLAVVTDHLLYLFASKSGRVYSVKSSGNAQNILERYGISPNQKVFVATMSSLDELWASQFIGSVTDQSPIFRDPIEWIRELIHFFTSHPEWILMIRPHPREFPNQNIEIQSEHASELRKVLVNDLPDNVKVNWPEDRVSLYDLMEVTSVCLNAWSSAGEELGCLGVPVISYCPEFLNWPASLDYVAKTKTEYFQLFETAIRSGWDFERIRRFYRWKVLQFSRSTMTIRKKEDLKKPLLKRAYNRLCRIFDPIHNERKSWRDRVQDEISTKRLDRLLRENHPTLAHLSLQEGIPKVEIELETKSIQKELRRIYQVLYQNKVPENPEFLQYRIWQTIQPTSTNQT